MLYKKHQSPKDIVFRIIVFPFIWFPLFAIIFLDIAIEIYHRICFPLCGMPYIKRSNYIVFDRFKLSYITMPEKISCLYCSYANGLFHYASKISLETERYWCGIKHRNFPGYVELVDHKDFVEYGDKKAYFDKYGA